MTRWTILYQGRIDREELVRLRHFIVFSVLLLPLLAACMGDDSDEPPTPQAATSTPTEVAQPSPTQEATDPPASATQTAAESPSQAPTQAPLDDIQITLDRVVEGLGQLTGIVAANDGSGRLFLVERGGRILVLRDGEVLDEPFLDLSDQVTTSGAEQGLLGLVFHPDYETNGTFYVDYTNVDGDTHVSRFRTSDDPDQADAESEVVILSVDQPAGNHNGGQLAFGPDGNLWIGLGDGGGAGDQFENAQNPATLLGTLPRIVPSTFDSPEDAPPYEIPPDNPLLDDPDARDEIWAIGLRNPWRFTFDSLTGDLYIADVGQWEWEEINVVPAGSPGGLNFGWPIIEGEHCFKVDGCSMDGLEFPVFEYNHNEGGCSVSGGEVYRGDAQPSLQGIYFFADFCSGKIWGMRWTDGGETQVQELLQVSGEQFSSFGHDEQGELYLTSLTGSVFQLTIGP